MNKRGMDGFSEMMPMGDEDGLITVDDLNDSLVTDAFLSEPVKDVLIFDDLPLPPGEVSPGLNMGEGGGRPGRGTRGQRQTGRPRAPLPERNGHGIAPHPGRGSGDRQAHRRGGERGIAGDYGGPLGGAADPGHGGPPGAGKADAGQCPGQFRGKGTGPRSSPPRSPSL